MGPFDTPGDGDDATCDDIDNLAFYYQNAGRQARVKARGQARVQKTLEEIKAARLRAEQLEEERDRAWRRFARQAPGPADRGEGGAYCGARGAFGDGDGGHASRTEAYRVLKLRPGASPAEVKAAYRKEVLASHPDKGGTKERFMLVQEAYEVLLGESDGI